jgi:hypothetical protein
LTSESAISAPSKRPARLVLHDAALGEHLDQVEVVDREPGIAADRRALEAGIRAVGIAVEDDVAVVSVKKNCWPSLRVIRKIAASCVVSPSRCARIAGVRILGMGVAKAGRGEGSEVSGGVYRSSAVLRITVRV